MSPLLGRWASSPVASPSIRSTAAPGRNHRSYAFVDTLDVRRPSQSRRHRQKYGDDRVLGRARSADLAYAGMLDARASKEAGRPGSFGRLRLDQSTWFTPAAVITRCDVRPA